MENSGLERLAENRGIAVTEQNARELLDQQQQLPLEEMDIALMCECSEKLAGQIEIDPSAKERLWAQLNLQIKAQAAQEKDRPSPRRRFFAAGLAAACLAVVLSFCLFVLPIKGRPADDLAQFSRELRDSGVVVRLPQWVPQGFSAQANISVSPQNGSLSASLEMRRGQDESIHIIIEDLAVSEAAQDALLAQVLSAGAPAQGQGRPYTIYEDGRLRCAYWLDGGYICCLTGNIAQGEMLQMVDSIAWPQP